MPWLRVVVPTEELGPGLQRIRDEFRVPGSFPPEAEAEAASARPRAAGRDDHRDLDLVTIDPPGSRDLDQAFGAERVGDGIRVRYAIADVAAFVRPGGAVDREAWARGLTLYLPDGRAPLHPPALSEGAASLLPGEDRLALLWTIDLDDRGHIAGEARLERTVVRSRRQLTYAGVQAALDGGDAEEPLQLLREIGTLRQRLEAERGGISLSLPVRELVPTPEGYRFAFEAPIPVEEWNAQVSLLAGHCAATIMADAGVGILRTLPPITEERVRRLRATARGLGVAWAGDESLGDVVRREAGGTPASAAFLTQVTHALRGADYRVIDGTPEPHGGLAMIYAHVTAPLRRLADRFANEIVVALCAGSEPEGWAVDALERLPAAMAEADRRSDRIEGETLNLAEAVIMAPHVGETFAATVIDVGHERATVQLHEPPVVAKLPPEDLEIGQDVEVRLRGADVVERHLDLEIV